MTTTRYPNNPDFHEIPPRCFDCGRFTGSIDSPDASLLGVWETVNPHDDMPTLHRNRCFDCATERVMDRYGIDDREEALHEILGAISG